MANCIDNTFRLRVTCTPCTIPCPPDSEPCCETTPCCDDTPCTETCCADAPRLLCLTFSNENFPDFGGNPSGYQLNGRHVVLEMFNNPDAGPRCVSGVGSGCHATGDPLQLWQGILSVPCGYSENQIHVVLACCLGRYIINLLFLGPTPPSEACITGVWNAPPIMTAGCEAPWGGGIDTECDPFHLSGTLKYPGSSVGGGSGPPFNQDWSIDFDIVEVPPEGCGDSIDSGDCCDDETGTHPDLSLVLSGDCPNALGSFNLVYSSDAWRHTDANITIALTCLGTGLWQIDVTTGFCHIISEGAQACNPFSATGFTIASCPGACNFNWSVTL